MKLSGRRYDNATETFDKEFIAIKVRISAKLAREHFLPYVEYLDTPLLVHQMGQKRLF